MTDVLERARQDFIDGHHEERVDGTHCTCGSTLPCITMELVAEVEWLRNEITRLRKWDEVLVWINDNIRPVYLDEEPWWAPIEEVMESGDTWQDQCEKARADVENLRAANRTLIEERDAAVERQTVVDAEVERLRQKEFISDGMTEAAGLVLDEMDRLRAIFQRVRDKASEWMRNESISADYQNALADAAEEINAVLDGEPTNTPAPPAQPSAGTSSSWQPMENPYHRRVES